MSLVDVHQAPKTSTPASAKATKTLRFADDVAAPDVSDWVSKSGGAAGAGGKRSAHDRSVERYFDNLITMIEDAAEGL